jgi:hypothetical protein
MQEEVLGDPAPLLDQHAVHQSDLAGWPAEGQDADLRRDAKASRNVGCGEATEPMMAHS